VFVATVARNLEPQIVPLPRSRLNSQTSRRLTPALGVDLSTGASADAPLASANKPAAPNAALPLRFRIPSQCHRLARPSSVTPPPLPVKTTQKFQITKRSGTTRRHVVHRRAAVRSEMMTRGSTTAQQSIATPSMVGTAADQPRHAGIGYEFFLSPLGKGKVTGE